MLGSAVYAIGQNGRVAIFVALKCARREGSMEGPARPNEQRRSAENKRFAANIVELSTDLIQRPTRKHPNTQITPLACQQTLATHISNHCAIVCTKFLAWKIDFSIFFFNHVM